MALAAAGFGYHNVFLSRFALLMPMVLAAAQQMQPDSPESLAQRLWEVRAGRRSTLTHANAGEAGNIMKLSADVVSKFKTFATVLLPTK